MFGHFFEGGGPGAAHPHPRGSLKRAGWVVKVGGQDVESGRVIKVGRNGGRSRWVGRVGGQDEWPVLVANAHIVVAT